jgi:hypothetical protein
VRTVGAAAGGGEAKTAVVVWAWVWLAARGVEVVWTGHPEA